jgi:hypothetical protein
MMEVLTTSPKMHVGVEVDVHGVVEWWTKAFEISHVKFPSKGLPSWRVNTLLSCGWLENDLNVI